MRNRLVNPFRINVTFSNVIASQSHGDSLALLFTGRTNCDHSEYDDSLSTINGIQRVVAAVTCIRDNATILHCQSKTNGERS